MSARRGREPLIVEVVIEPWRAAPPGNRRHASYYIEEGNTIILVENTLYSIPRYLLKKSAVFHTMFSLDPGPDGAVEGTADKPLDLSKADPSLKKADFDCFVEALLSNTYSEYEGTKSELQSVAMLAHKWDFTDLHNYAMKELDGWDLTPIEALELAARYHSTDRLLEAYVVICLRMAPADLSVYNAMAPYLDVSKVFDLQRARRAVWKYLSELLKKNSRKHKGACTCHWPECLNKPEYCHTLKSFGKALEIVLKDVDGKANERTTLEDAFKTALVEAHPFDECSVCETQVDQRIRSYARFDELKKIVKEIMMPVAPRELSEEEEEDSDDLDVV